MEAPRSKSSLAVAEALLALALVFAPLAIGAVDLWAIAVAAALAGGGAIAAALARPQRVTWPVWAAIAVAGWVGLQAVPLPPSVLRAVSPHAAGLLEATLGRDAVGWHALSLDPAATAREFVRLLGYAAAFFTAARLAGDRAATRRLARVVGGMTVVQVLIVAGHAIAGTSMVYGVVPLSTSNPIFGSFGNPNHLAAYLTLGIPVLGTLAIEAEEPALRIALGATAAAAAAVVVLTASRSGIVGLLALLGALWLLMLRRQARASRSLRLTLGTVLVLLFATGALSILEPARLAKVRTLLQPSRLRDEVKVRAWRDVPAVIADYRAVGVGRGAFEEVFPAYKRVPEQLTFSHVECAPLQLLVDLGVVAGAAAMLAWIGALGRAARRRGAALRTGAVVGIAAVTLHELGDFALDASAAVGLGAAVLWGLALPARDAVSRRWRPLAVGFGACAFGLGAIAVAAAYRGDLGRDLAAVDESARHPGPDFEPQVRAAIARHPAEPWFPLMAGIDALARQHRPQAALDYLRRSLALDPSGWKPHLAIGETLWSVGRPSEAIAEYRAAYRKSRADPTVPAVIVSHPGVDFDSVLGPFADDDPALLEPLATYLEQKHLDGDGARAANRLLAIAPDGSPARATAHRLLARIAHRASRFDEVLSETAPLPPEDAEVALLRADALAGLDRPRDAEAALVASFTKEPSIRVGFPLTTMRIDDGRPDEALATLDQLPRDVPPAPLAYIEVLQGRALEAAGRERDAIHAFTDAARIDPCDANRLTLGSAYERLGLLRDALLVYRELARSSAKPSPEVLRRLAAVEAALGVGDPGDGGRDRETP